MQNIIRIMGKEGRTTIPLPIRESIGLVRNDILEFTRMPDGHGGTIRILKICDNCAERESGDEHDSITLLDFLNRLTEPQQKAALAYLSSKWAS